jgi:hypothetical protein
MKQLACLVLLVMWFPALGFGQQKKAETWADKKAKHFKPISDAHRNEIAQAVPGRATAKPQRARRILVFYRCGGFIHSSIPHGNLALEEMGRKTEAFTADLADTYDVFTPENLEQYD